MEGNKNVRFRLMRRHPGLNRITIALSAVVMIVWIRQTKAGYWYGLVFFERYLEYTRQTLEESDTIPKCKVQCVSGIPITVGKNESNLGLRLDTLEGTKPCNPSQPIFMRRGSISRRKSKAGFVKQRVREHFYWGRTPVA
jgi:hypothetical protein